MLKLNNTIVCLKHKCVMSDSNECPMCVEEANESSDQKEIEYLAGLWAKLKNFYAQPVDGFWPLRPMWVPDLNKATLYESPWGGRCIIDKFRRFTFEEFTKIFHMERFNEKRHKK